MRPSESDPCPETPAFQRAARDERERETERAASPIPAPSPSPSPSPLPSPPPSPLLFPLDAWIPELKSMNETGSLPDLGCTHRPSPTPSESVWPTELDVDEDCPIPAPSPSPLPLEVSGSPGLDLDEVDPTRTPSPSPLPPDADDSALLEFVDEVRHYHLRQGEPDPWELTLPPPPPVTMSESHATSESYAVKSAHDYSHYSEHSSPEGPFVDEPYIHYGSPSHPQWSDLNDWTHPQNETQENEVWQECS